MTTGIDRTEASRALAKVIAYQNVGKEKEARVWLKALLFAIDYPELAKTIARPD